MTLVFPQYFPADHRCLLLEKARRVVHPDGARIVEEGERLEGISVIHQGRVRVEKRVDTAAVPLRWLGTGEVFGEMAFLESEAASASIVAEGEVSIDLFPSADVMSLLTSVPGFAICFYKGLAMILSHRLRDTDNGRPARKETRAS